MLRKIIMLAVTLMGILAPVYAPPVFPTELYLTLLTSDGSNIDTSLLLTIDYTDGDMNPQSVNSVDNPGIVTWSIIEGKSRLYAVFSAKNQTDIKITVDGYESIYVKGDEAGVVVGDYNLNAEPTATTTTTTSTTTTTTSIATTTTTTIPPHENKGGSSTDTSDVNVNVEDEKIFMTAAYIPSGSSVTFTVPSSEKTPLRELILKVYSEVTDVEVTASVLAEKPSHVEAGVPGVSYRYIGVSHNIDDSKISSATVKFNIEKSWFVENNVPVESVRLSSYLGGSWEKLSTSKLSDGPDYYTFEAVSSGMDIFSISGLKGEDAQAKAQGDNSLEKASPEAGAKFGMAPPVTTVPPPGGKPVRTAALILFSVAAASFAAYFLIKR
ncbi:MAG: PGF-pre-PGF domain-containing protein [Candidatus Hydrothermarchaeaceae archaeon]